MKEKKKKQLLTIKLKRPKKPPRVQISDAEFRRRLKTIGEWRKKYFAELRAELRAAGSR